MYIHMYMEVLDYVLCLKISSDYIQQYTSAFVVCNSVFFLSLFTTKIYDLLQRNLNPNQFIF